MSTPTIEQAIQLALVHHQAGRLPQAESIYRDILARVPNHPDALHLQGVIAHQTGRNEQAIELIQRAIRLNPAIAAFHSNLGQAYRALDRIDEAIAAYRTAISLDPTYAVAHSNLASALTRQGKTHEAIAAYRAAVRFNPRDIESLINLGVALQTQGELDESVATYQRAIQIKPDSAEAFSNLAIVLKQQGKHAESVAACRKAIDLKPDLAEAHSNLGNALTALGDLDAAVAAFRHAISLRPDFAEAHGNIASALLRYGRFEQAWPEYEWRSKTTQFSSPIRNFPQPRWDGSDLNGQTILLHAEQGIGDTFQFIRYTWLVAAKGGRIVIEVQRELLRLIQSSAPDFKLIAQGDPLPAFDTHVPLGSLPLLFKTTLDSIPADVPYVRPAPDLISKWRQRIEANPSTQKVGLNWAGNPNFPGEKFRSPRKLALFAPLAAAANVQFYSLQKGDAAAQTTNPPPGLNILDFTRDLTDFADTAALMSNLDLIITSDTAVAHLAGAMGKKTWLLLSTSPDWRWLRDRTDSPWYPTMRLVRQATTNDWSTPIAQIAAALQAND